MGENLIQVNWDTHKQILFDNLGSLRDKGTHTDVTLACEGHFYPAHKLILTLCSGYFGKALEIAQNSPSVFFLCGIKKSTLEALLEFIYNGTVTIPSEDVDDIAKAGKMLQIPELSDIETLISSPSDASSTTEECTDSLPTMEYFDTNLQPMVILERETLENLTKKRKTRNLSENEEFNVYEEDSFYDKRRTNKRANIIKVVNDDDEDMSDICTPNESQKDISYEGEEEDHQEEESMEKKTLFDVMPHKIGDSSPTLPSPALIVSMATKKDSPSKHCINFDDEGNSNSEYEFEGWEPSTISPMKIIPRDLFVMIERSPQAILQQSHRCFTCDHMFSSKNSLFNHFTKHHINLLGSHSCQICRRIFTWGKSLKSHIKSHKESNGKFCCSKCNYNSPYFKCLEFHVAKQHNAPAVTNGVSNSSLGKNIDHVGQNVDNVSSETLEEVLKAISTDFEKYDVVYSRDDYDMQEETLQSTSEPLDCPTCLCCDLKFDDNESYSYHKQTSCKLLECPFCLKVYIREKKKELDEHKLLHNLSAKPYSCPYCRYESKEYSSRDEHLKRHSLDCKYLCPNCYFESRSSGSLSEHISENHSEAPQAGTANFD